MTSRKNEDRAKDPPGTYSSSSTNVARGGGRSGGQAGADLTYAKSTVSKVSAATTKAVDKGSTTLCSEVDAKARVCLKDGCKTRLGNHKRVLNRCYDHRQLCSIKDCRTKLQRDGLCQFHYSQRHPDTATLGKAHITCQKDGCDVKLNKKQKLRCANHTKQCKKKGCMKQYNSTGYCGEHTP